MLKNSNLVKVAQLLKSASKRSISSTSVLSSSIESTRKPGFLQRILSGNSTDASPTNAHSVLLANQEFLYEYQVHDVKPEFVSDFQKQYCDYMPNLINRLPNRKLVGAWRSEIGVQDRFVHLWRYDSYEEFSKAFDVWRKDKEIQDFVKKYLPMVSRREKQLCLSFTYWEQPPARDTEHIYELRSYSLKPGTLIEWGNSWSRGIRTRFDSRVAGMFTQVGPIYWVHHMWAYKNLQARKEKRENAWSKPGWDECVANTVPLIRKMESKILVALPYSPLK